MLSDVSAERAVLAGVFSYNGDAYYDIADLLTERTFTLDSNVAIFKCIKHIFDKDQGATLDLPTILSSAQEIQLSNFFKKNDELKHLQAIMATPVNIKNVRRLAAKIRKLEIARLFRHQLEEARVELLSMTGDEAISRIVGVAEDKVFNLTSLLSDNNDGPVRLLKDVRKHVEYLMDNPVEQIGISTGYPVYDMAIGGGLRPGVHIIGARTKVGKSWLGDNVGVHIAKNIGIPVLNLDTEMDAETHTNRIMAILSGYNAVEIETGKLGKNIVSKNRLLSIADENADIPLHYQPIYGKPFEEQIALMRRWLIKEVGLKADGTANDCVLIYDYIKLMSAQGLESLQEHQLLGFLMTTLHNFCARYKVPVLAFIQLNRDGITQESTGVVAGSDRIVQLCTSFSIYKFKSDEETAEDGPDCGNRKLVPVITRFGQAWSDKDYINMQMTSYGKIVEGKTKTEDTDGFITDEIDNVE